MGECECSPIKGSTDIISPVRSGDSLQNPTASLALDERELLGGRVENRLLSSVSIPVLVSEVGSFLKQVVGLRGELECLHDKPGKATEYDCKQHTQNDDRASSVLKAGENVRVVLFNKFHNRCGVLGQEPFDGALYEHSDHHVS